MHITFMFKVTGPSSILATADLKLRKWLFFPFPFFFFVLKQNFHPQLGAGIQITDQEANAGIMISAQAEVKVITPPLTVKT